MFRGNPPQGKLLHLTTSLQRSLLAPKEMEVELDSVTLKISPRIRRQISNTLAIMASRSSKNGAAAAAGTGGGSGGDKSDSSADGGDAAASGPELSLAVQLGSKGNKNMTLYTCDVPGSWTRTQAEGGASAADDTDVVNDSTIENPPNGLVQFAVNQGENEN